MAVANPVFIAPPSLRFFGWCTTRIRGSSAAMPVGDDAGVVGRRVVDDDQLVVADLAVFDQDLARPSPETEGALDVRLLVPHRVEDRQLLERRHATRLRLRELVGAGHAVAG